MDNPVAIGLLEVSVGLDGCATEAEAFGKSTVDKA